TGLEEFLAEYGVQVGNAQVVNLEDEHPQYVVAVPNRQSSNPIRPLFGRGVTLYEVRELQTREPSQGGHYSTDVLAATRPNKAALEPDLRLPESAVDHPS